MKADHDSSLVPAMNVLEPVSFEVRNFTDLPGFPEEEKGGLDDGTTLQYIAQLEVTRAANRRPSACVPLSLNSMTPMTRSISVTRARPSRRGCTTHTMRCWRGSALVDSSSTLLTVCVVTCRWSSHWNRGASGTEGQMTPQCTTRRTAGPELACL